MSLTCRGHLDTVGLLARLADARRVVGPDTEAVLSQRLQARADVVGCVLTTACYLGPAPRLVRAFLFDLHNVTQHSCASVEAGSSPAQDQGLGGQLGDDRWGCWWIRPV